MYVNYFLTNQGKKKKERSELRGKEGQGALGSSYSPTIMEAF